MKRFVRFIASLFKRKPELFTVTKGAVADRMISSGWWTLVSVHSVEGGFIYTLKKKQAP